MDFSDDKFETVRGRPLPKEMLSFYNISYPNRLFVNVSDNNKTWQDDLVIAERLFGTMVLAPFHLPEDDLNTTWNLTLDVLKQRMKYPGVKEDPHLLQLAKTWVLPAKLVKGTSLDNALSLRDTEFQSLFADQYKQLNIEEEKVHFLKVELANGLERPFLYKFLDAGFRPSLILVKWSEDLDNHVATAHCAGHLMNCGYSLARLEGEYALYVFLDQTLYDICSMKTVGLKNPIMESLLQSVSLLQGPPPTARDAVVAESEGSA